MIEELVSLSSKASRIVIARLVVFDSYARLNYYIDAAQLVSFRTTLSLLISRPDFPLRVRPLEIENNYFLYYNIYNKQFYTTLSLQNIEESYCYCVCHRRSYRFCGGYEAGC